MVAYLLGGVLPFALGLAGLVQGANYDGGAASRSAAEPMEELKRRYAAGEIEDDVLERKVEALLDAGAGPRPRRPDDDEGEASRERASERARG